MGRRRPAIFKRKFDSVARNEGFRCLCNTTGSSGFRGCRPGLFRDSGRCHLDSVSLDTPIRDIVDRCRMWESHSDENRKSPPITDVGRKYPAVTGYSLEFSFYADGSPGMYPRQLNRVSRWQWSRMFLVKDHPCRRSGTESCWIRL